MCAQRVPPEPGIETYLAEEPDACYFAVREPNAVAWLKEQRALEVERERRYHEVEKMWDAVQYEMTR